LGGGSSGGQEGGNEGCFQPGRNALKEKTGQREGHSMNLRVKIEKDSPEEAPKPKPQTNKREKKKTTKDLVLKSLSNFELAGTKISFFWAEEKRKV